MTAIGTYSDGSVRDMTESVDWLSSDDGRVSVSNVSGTKGLVTGIVVGSASISAMDPQTSVSSGDSGGSCATTVLVPVDFSLLPFYPDNGANLNDYIKDDGVDAFNASDTACDPASDTACLNAGLYRYVTVPERSSCSGLAAEDSLGIFEWDCEVLFHQPRMISSGVKAGKELSDLNDFDTGQWKPLSVAIQDHSEAILVTSPEALWSNPIVINNDGSDGSDMTEGEVHIVTADPSATYAFGADKTALVIQPGVTLTGSAALNEWVVSANSRSFIWMEGTIAADGDTYGFRLDDTRFSTVRNLKASNAGTISIMISRSSNNTLSNITGICNAISGGAYAVYLNYASNNTLKHIKANCAGGAYGLYLDNSSYNRLSDITVSNTLDVYIRDSNNNILNNVTSTNNGQFGLYLRNASDNVVSNLTTSNTGRGVSLVVARNNILNNITASNNVQWGVRLSSSSNNSLSNIAVSNNLWYGLALAYSQDNIVNNVASGNNEESGIYLEGTSDNNRFSGEMRVGNNAVSDCYENGGTNPGLVDGTCTVSGTTGSNDYPVGYASDATLTIGIDTTASYLGKVTAGDAVNSSDSDGSAAFAAITDWTGFASRFRGWGREGSDFPNADNRHKCFPGETCRIWDWRLAWDDTGDAGNPVNLDAVSLPDGNDTITHTWSDASTSEVLRNAVEIQGDGIGNDNTLCESDETCLYTPNIGSYQGHGELIEVSYIGTGGVLENITLMQNETNGY